MGSFIVDHDSFRLNGKPFRILSGAMHYFRIHPAYWQDRLRKLQAMGLNTVETYVPWNLHEPSPGDFQFTGGLDILAYIQQAAELGLYVIVRPGPYICSEWDLGGLPAWLLRDPGMRLRCYHEPYLASVDRYFDALLPILAPLQLDRGGPIIAMQVENEYGSYGNDQAYLQYLADGMRTRGIDLLLFTSDGMAGEMLRYGTLPDIFKTVNFSSDYETAYTNLKEIQPEGPFMCSEFWDGWFDHWGEDHHTRDVEESAQLLDKMLAAGASVNFYMFHGGTNFGFLNGANSENGHYRPTVTSYDYDAPLNEAGDPTPKYTAYRQVIAKHVALPNLPIPDPSPKISFPEVHLTESVGLFDSLDFLSSAYQRVAPEPMEMFGQSYGFILYRTELSEPRPAADLTILDLHDRAQIFVDSRYIETLDRERQETELSLEIPPGGLTLDILVENMGRINFGPELIDRKGITKSVMLGQQYLFGWSIYPLPLDDLTGLHFSDISPVGNPPPSGPAFYRGTFKTASIGDTFLALPGWQKGVCWINGFNLGRYWARGPQRTLYIPAPLMREGENELIVLELHEVETPIVKFQDHPILG